MRALVTGGFGFLGSHLVEALVDSGVSVHVVDNLTTSTIDIDMFWRRLSRPDLVTYDLVTVSEYCGRWPQNHFDGIYHLASVVGPVGVLEHGGGIVQSVVDDTYDMARFAASSGARLLDVSTSEIYGGGRGGACAESDTKLVSADVTVRSEYAVAKLACEVALVNTARRTGLPVTIIRPFNIAGPRQGHRGGFVLPRFIRQAMSGQPLTVYGDGTQVRAFTHVKDVARGVMLGMYAASSPAIYNLGNPANKTTILKLADLVCYVTGSPSPIVHVDPTTLHGPTFAEASDKYPDSDLAQRELGWVPEHDLEAIVRDTYEYMRKERRD